ncbi:MAG: DNA polymerase III subunit delta [Acidobacteria bacterium]|nr:DNA polymerase III subunit delta [Acidobacteriota bacterium]
MAAPSALDRALAAGEWPRVVLLWGDDEAGRRRAVERIIAAVPEEERATGVERYGAEAPLARVLDSARTATLLGGRRVVIAHEPAGLVPGASEDVRRAWTGYLERPPGHATLVLVAEKVDRRIDAVKRILETGLALEFAQPREREMVAWVQARARERGLRLDAAAVQLLADAVGVNTSAAEREMDKLQLAAGPRGAIGAPLVEEMLGPGRAVGAFALEDALLSGVASRALEVLSRRLARTDTSLPLALLAQLANVCRKLALARGVLDGGGDAEGVREALGCHPFVAGKYAQAAGRLGRRAGPGLAACVVADGRLKSGGDPYQALAGVVLALCPGPAGLARRTQGPPSRARGESGR